MIRLGFDERWVTLAMETIHTASYSVLVNGEPKGFIQPTRGIKQGDPLSPYLFLLCTEGLSAMLRRAEEQKRIQGILSCRGGVRVSHLPFADDCLLFCQARIEECQNLLHLLHRYEMASGQAINREKSALFFSKNTRANIKLTVQNMLGAQIFHDCEHYLGLPMITGKSKTNTFKGVREKITRKVTGWKEKFILKAGREVLIKTVAQAVPTYAMSIFKIPKQICEDINSVLARCWWGQLRNEGRVHWISWNRLCKSKKMGGMGFRDLHAFNLALLAKQAWKLVQQTDSLFYRIYKAKYFPTSTFLDAEMGHNPSYVWRSLLSAREVILAGSKWQVGNGETIKILSHEWLPHPPGLIGDITENMCVKELINQQTKQWDRGKVNSLFDEATRQEILAIPLTQVKEKDKVIWKDNKAHGFSVKSAYQVVLRLAHQQVGESSQNRSNEKIWKHIWTLNVPPKVRNFIWRACSNILPTRENLHRRKIAVDPQCEFCKQQPESVYHMLWECPFARNTWAVVKGRLQKCPNAVADFFDLLRLLQSRLDCSDLEVWAITAWALWNARNKFYFENMQLQPKAIADGALALLTEYQRLMEAQASS